MLALALAVAPVAAADAYLSAKFPADKPGAAVAIVWDGAPVLAKGYGLADVAARTPITRRTAFDLASCTKSYTAAAVCLLMDRGKLSPDDDVRKWLPAVPCVDPARPIRVRDLLQHTSGLPEYFRLLPRPLAECTNADVLAAVAKSTPRRPGGPNPNPKKGLLDYTNTNYVLLAELVRAIDGRPLARFLAEDVFAPLGMVDTRLCDTVPFVVPNRASGYDGGKPSRDDGAVHGDGNVFTTLDDFLKWEAGLAAGKLLRPETWRAAWTSGMLDDGRRLGYGWGWGVVEDGRRVFHEGGWSGTATLIGRQVGPARSPTVLVLSNEESTEPGAVAAELTRRMPGR